MLSLSFLIFKVRELYLFYRKKVHDIHKKESGREKVLNKYLFLLFWGQVCGVIFIHREDGTVIVYGCNQAKHMRWTREINEWICQQETLLFYLPAKADFPKDNAFLWIIQQPLNPDIVSQAGNMFTVKMLTSTSSFQSPAATFCKLN